MKRTTIVIILLILVVSAALGIIVFSQRAAPKKYTGSPARLTIGTGLFEVSGLIWIAEAQGYFAENGLNVTIKVFEAGKYAVNALQKGEIEIATASELVFVGKAMDGEKIQTIGSIAKADMHYLTARKDRGILQISDLKGKKIGLVRETSAEFYLGRYLQLHDMNLQDVTVTDLKPTEVEESLIKGEVDAAVIWDPYAYPIEKALGRNAVIWTVQSGQMMYWLLLAESDYITGHPELIDRLLLSFNQAEQFVVNNPDRAKKIVQNRLNAERAYMERIWPNTRLALSLDQGLIIAMEDESRWIIDSNVTGNLKMPYYPDYIYWQGLEKVKPSSVTVIH
jgi:ABC-type nitrate/sulfonate/bicarbonate transport system substrate-binding protein